MGRDDAGLRDIQLKVGALETEQLASHWRKRPQSQAQSNQAEKPVVNTCPHCGVRLSPLDIKLNKCFKCWAVLDSEAAVKPRQGCSGLEVHI